MRVAQLELDLEVFTGPFDLLLTLVLREEIDLIEVDLADVVLTYLDHLEQSGELDLESTTEFLVLIAALLELKSRLLLPSDEAAVLELDPSEAADELLERLLQAKRYRGAAAHLADSLKEQSGYRYRVAPLPAGLKSAPLQEAPAGAYNPERLGKAIGALLRHPPKIDLSHVAVNRVTVASRLEKLRSLLKRGRFQFDEAVSGADRVTVAVTLFALLELYKRGEASWEQSESFGPIEVAAHNPPAAVGASA